MIAPGAAGLCRSVPTKKFADKSSPPDAKSGGKLFFMSQVIPSSLLVAVAAKLAANFASQFSMPGSLIWQSDPLTFFPTPSRPRQRDHKTGKVDSRQQQSAVVYQ